jgi:long-chain acyl-CoA synthetase
LDPSPSNFINWQTSGAASNHVVTIYQALISDVSYMTKNFPNNDPEMHSRDFESVIQMFAHAAEAFPERTAIISSGDQISYRDYRNCVAGMATELAKYNIRGERVMMLNPNSITSAVVVYAVWAAGAQVAMLNPLYTKREIIPLIEEIEPKIILCGSEFRDQLLPAASKSKASALLTLDEGKLDLNRWQGGADLNLPTPFPKGDDPALFLFTGGTTGIPKGAMHSHTSLVMTGRLLQASWKVETAEEIFLNVAPQCHSWGLCSSILMPVLTCNTVVTLPRFNPQVVLDELIRYRISVFAGGPAAIYNAILTLPDLASADLSYLHLCFGGGSIFNNETVNRWRRATGNSIYVAYGMSEMAPIAMHRAGQEPKVGTVGLPVHFSEMQVVDLENGEEILPAGENGEFRIKGPNKFSAYWNRPEETANTVRDGWVYTGDIGHFDEDGMVVIADRKKDMAIVGGYNVFPKEIDEVLYAHPAILEAAALGVPDDYRGEVIHAFVALAPGVDADSEQIIDYCKQNLSKYKVPEKVNFIDALPKTPANKIDKQQLREMAADTK